MKLAPLMAAALLASALAAPALAQDIDTTQPFTVDIEGFGPGVSQAYGQTFTVGTEAYLNSFSLYLDGGLNGAGGRGTGSPFDYKGYIYAWDGAKATGPALYASGVKRFAGTTRGMPEEERFETGDLLLTSGRQYVAFLSTGEFPGQPFTFTGMPVAGASVSPPYPGGAFVADNHTAFADLTTKTWDLSTGILGDAWFKADFSATATPPSGAVPEPATWAVMVGGLGLVGAALRRRRRRDLAIA